jgi:hypothetical protein
MESAGQVDMPDFKTLVDAQFTKRGERRLRASQPFTCTDAWGNAFKTRARYIHRMIQFHNGRDMCLPMGAQFETHGDPWRSELDAIAEYVVERVYGRSSRGRARWYKAMHGESADWAPSDFESKLMGC